MGKAIPYAYRQKIVSRCKSGESYEDISTDLGYSKSAVRKLWYKYQREGESAFETNYSNCGRLSSYDEDVREKVNAIRDNGQGGTYVNSKFRIKHPNLVAPSARTLQNWWVKEQTNRKRGCPSPREKRDGVSRHTILGK